MSDLLDRAIAAHGGLERWHGVRAIDVVFNFSGGLLDLKGFPDHHRPAVSVDTFAELSLPVLVANGVTDVMIPAEHSFAIARTAPNSEASSLPRCRARVSIPVRRRVHSTSIGIPMTFASCVPDHRRIHNANAFECVWHPNRHSAEAPITQPAVSSDSNSKSLKSRSTCQHSLLISPTRSIALGCARCGQPAQYAEDP
jgi:hypothetical protein